MLKDIKSTAKHSIIYAFGNMGVKVVGFLLIPLLTNPKLLSTNDYGALAILEATLQVLIGVFSFAMTAGLARWYWDKEFIDRQKSIFFSTITFLSIVIVPTTFILNYFSNQISILIFDSTSYTQLIKITIFTASFQIINNLTFTLLRLKSKSIASVGIQIIKFTGIFGLILYSLKFKGLGLMGIWQAYLIVEVVIFVILLPLVFKNCQFKFQYKIIKEMLSFGMPLMLASLSGVLLTVTDRYMLNSMEGLEKTAIYSVGFRIANTLKVVITSSLTLAFLPLNMKKIGVPGNQYFYSKVMKYSSYLFALALLCMSLFSLEVLKVITGSSIYWEAYGVIAIVSFALLFGQLKDNGLIGITIMKKTKITGILIFLTSILNVGLNILLIPLMDIYGAATATLISQLVFFISVYIASQKFYKIPYEYGKIGVSIALLGVFVLIGILISDLETLLRLVIKSILLIAYPFVLALFNYYDQSEKQVLKQLYFNWKNPKEFTKNLKRFLE